jgi:hypothetical protein
VKEYLENNASDALTEKINNGVPIEKDGKPLINKKDLAGFMKYACAEAKKQADKGANGACIQDSTVFGWAIHYFEEDAITGKLYNADGTEYKPKPAPRAPYTPPPVTPPKPKPQMSLFDLTGVADADARETDSADRESDDTEDLSDDESEIDGGDGFSDEPETGATGIGNEYESSDETGTNASEPQGDTEDGCLSLTQISETEYVDQNGEVYEVEAARPVPVTDTDTLTLIKLVGDTLIVR